MAREYGKALASQIQQSSWAGNWYGKQDFVAKTSLNVQVLSLSAPSQDARRDASVGFGVGAWLFRGSPFRRVFGGCLRACWALGLFSNLCALSGYDHIPWHIEFFQSAKQRALDYF